MSNAIFISRKKRPEFALLSTFATNSSELPFYADFGVSLGDPASKRFIIVVVAGTSGSGERLMSSVTVAGTPLNEDVFSRNTGNSRNGHVGIYSGVIPSGTSGNVVVTWTGSMLNTAFATYRAVNLKNNSLFDFYTDRASSSSINIPPKGFAVGCAAHVSGGPPLAWTGLIEDIEHTTQYGEVLGVASQGILPAETGRFIQVSPGGGSPTRHAFASYG